MMIKLTGMYERTSAKSGLQYFTGRLNMGARVLLLQNLKAGEGDPPWELLLADAENTLTPQQTAAWKAEHPVGQPHLHRHHGGGGERELAAPGPKARPEDADQGAGPAEDFNDPLPPELMP